jgi:uncharacterized protein YkwD
MALYNRAGRTGSHLLAGFLVSIFVSVLSLFSAADRACGVDGMRNDAPSAFERELLTSINQYRTGNGLHPLSPDRTLIRLAENHSMYMHDKGVLNHDNFEGRFSQSGRMLCVENVGWNSPTPQAQLKLWRGSRGHDANLLNVKIGHVGISRVGSYVTFFGCK